VLEIKRADLEISLTYTSAFDQVEKRKGISLRFSRYMRTREDKSPKIAQQSAKWKMFRYQPSVSNDFMGDGD
jgi:hypothetical protein